MYQVHVPGTAWSSGRAELPADWHAFDAADEARADALGLAGELHANDAPQHLLERAAQLEPREVRSEADVLAATEPDVVVRRAIDAEAERILEHIFVAV